MAKTISKRPSLRVNTLYLKFRLFHPSAIFAVDKDDIHCHLDLPLGHLCHVHAMDAFRWMVVVQLDLQRPMGFDTAMKRLDDHVEIIFQYGNQQAIGFLTGLAVHDRM